MSRILIVEDEAHLAQGLKFNLEAEGHTIVVLETGEAALELLLARPADFDAVVLDIMLPGKDGFTVAHELRQARQFVPVLMLTARGRPEDVLKGFESGADDYLPKPFDLKILLARIRSLLRRSRWMVSAAHDDGAVKAQSPEYGRVQFGGKVVDFGTLELRVRDQVLRLTLMEADLLRYLMRNGGQAVSRKSILEDVWDLHEDTDTRAIDNFIVRLRKYIEDDPTRPRHLLTVRGVGYRFVAEPEAKSSPSPTA